MFCVTSLCLLKFSRFHLVGKSVFYHLSLINLYWVYCYCEHDSYMIQYTHTQYGWRIFASLSLLLVTGSRSRLMSWSFVDLEDFTFASLHITFNWRQLYKNRSSRKIDSRRLCSREWDFQKTISLTENQFSGKTYFYTIHPCTIVCFFRSS